MTIELSVAWARRFGEDVRAVEAFGTLTVDVPAESWNEALLFARDELGCRFFDWLTAVDELDAGFSVVAHVHSLERGHHLLVRTRVPRADPRLVSATGVYRGANWHERETFEMFGVVFDGHPDLRPLLLPDGFEGNPLRKEFVLAARVAKPWPGAKEPREPGQGAPSRRRMLPPGVPQDWGPAAREAPARPAPRRRPVRPAVDEASGAAGSGGAPPAAPVDEGSGAADADKPPGAAASDEGSGTAASDKGSGTAAAEKDSGTRVSDEDFGTRVSDEDFGTAASDEGSGAAATEEDSGAAASGDVPGAFGAMEAGEASGELGGGSQRRTRRRARGIDPEGEGGGDV